MVALLDTNIVLYSLGGRLAEPLPVCDCRVSVITEIEVLSYPSLSADEAAVAREFLQCVGVEALSSEVKDATIELRRKHKLRVPDAIVVATARILDAVLYTNDSRLLTIPEITSVPLRLRDL
ncbi:MAG TPA: type II toxin-antitoxin system VapC family toxin [Candidatus Latescibacteria bacterium]|nr:type II toxin-antitoxin system VapC family toxin [Candidatus Latescibacterota bacterium]HOS65949.1 type II toxin-antitoxin system VapC family toxin [Candidatus Latescibacterota bacterium]HPK75386.1 type II toxin-antitoxin system VapC family toxin [Candidatus Latescibacterota bacterium]HRS95878.1 type II toxin-antitoxin system VapC family toxin [Candidatus Latescibacterota bacterium]